MSKGKTLKGKTFIQQKKNIINRTLQLGNSKGNCKLDNQIHSINTLNYRNKLLDKYILYLNTQNITTGKINQYMNEEHLSRFINQTVNGLTYTSSKTLISGISGLITSLKQTNVDIKVSSDFFTKIKDEVKEVKYTFQSSKDIHKSFSNVNNVIAGLYNKSMAYGVLGNTLLESGFRYSEAIRLLKSPNQYIKNNYIVGMKGKSGKVYAKKYISTKLKEKIYSLSNEDKKINHKSFCNAISSIEINKTPHSFRYEFSKIKYKQLISASSGLSHNVVMKKLSIELNHFRNTTPYYLNRL